MHCFSVAPRTFCDAALAQSVRRRVSRSGPTVPVAEAAASVWQPLHPADVNSALAAEELIAALAPDELLLEELPLDELLLEELPLDELGELGDVLDELGDVLDDDEEP